MDTKNLGFGNLLCSNNPYRLDKEILISDCCGAYFDELDCVNEGEETTCPRCKEHCKVINEKDLEV